MQLIETTSTSVDDSEGSSAMQAMYCGCYGEDKLLKLHRHKALTGAVHVRMQ